MLTNLEVDRAHGVRALALAAWLEGESPLAVSSLLLTSRSLFEEAFDSLNAAISGTLAGLLLSDAHPSEALPCFDHALPDLSSTCLPLALARLGKALSLALLGDPAEALHLLRDPSTPLLAAPDEVLAAHWLHARASAAIGEHPDASWTLEVLLGRLLDNGRFPQAILAALDLCQFAPVDAQSGLFDRIVQRLSDSLPPAEPHATRLRAFQTLALDLQSGLPFNRVAAAFPVLVPSIHRFPIHSLCSIGVF